MPAWIDLTGKKFGSLTVLAYLGKSIWLCDCDCERESPKVKTGDLKRKDPKCRQCGNESAGQKKRIKNLVGKRWGLWKVTKDLEKKNSAGSWLYEITCACGLTTDTTAGTITQCLKGEYQWDSCRKCSAQKSIPKTTIKRENNWREKAILARNKLRGEIPDEWFDLPLTNTEALEKGLTKYFSAIPCRKKGHVYPRRVNQGCVLCAEDRSPKYERSAVRMERRRQMTKKYRSTPTGRIASQMRIRIKDALNKYIDGIKLKKSKTEKLIGCSYHELVLHLESLFKDGMTWENYGDWEVDHIRPCSSFDLTDENQQKTCFNWRNLNPLWKKENRSKNDSYDLLDESDWTKKMLKKGYKGKLFLLYKNL